MTDKPKKPSRLDEWEDDGEPDSGPTLQILAVCEKPDVKQLIETAAKLIPGATLTFQKHANFTATAAGSSDLVLVECRVIEGFEDLELVRAVRQQRPLMAISVLSANDDSEYVGAVFGAGATDYISLPLQPTVVAARCASWIKSTRSSRLMELQNTELVQSLQSLRLEIVERKRAEEERNAAQEQVHHSAKMASLGEMAGGIAHEIKTPLAIITGGVSMLKDGSLDEADSKSMLADIEKMADRIAAIIRGLKSFSRDAEADPFEPTAVSEIIADTMALCDEVIERAGVKLTVTSPKDLVVDCQPTQISQIMMNLIANAKHAVEKATNPAIHVEAKDLGTDWEFSVTDNGSGVPVDLREKIFLPFFTTKEKGVGTGLGLSISSKIAVAHGGKLSLDPQKQGSRFVLRLSKHPVQVGRIKTSA